MKHAALLLLLPLMSTAQNYSARKAPTTALRPSVLTDAAHKTEVSIAPSVGNMAYEMKVNGRTPISAGTEPGRTESQAARWPASRFCGRGRTGSTRMRIG